MNPASPQGQAATAQGGQEEEPQEDESPEEGSPEAEAEDHDRKVQRAQTVVKAIKEIPKEKRTPGDTKKLRSAAQMVAKAGK